MITNTFANITAFHNAGDDALTNMFTLSIANSATLLTDTTFKTKLENRVTNFSLPEKVVNTYDEWYRGHKLAIPGGLDGDPKTTTFTFRADKNQKLYNALRKLAHSAKSVAETDLDTYGANNIRSTITVSTLSQVGIGADLTTWTLRGWFPTTVQGMTFDAGSGEPLLVQVTGSYLICEEPEKTTETTDD